MGVVVIELNCETNLVFEYGKRKFRSMFWKVRAEVRRQKLKKQQQQMRFSFHYDPFSYALNFDDGDFGMSDGEIKVSSTKAMSLCLHLCQEMPEPMDEGNGKKVVNK
ncbi:hypothetical protein RJ639_018817 [Escallonia herrerae]|uniref:Uncharacterized protein n=1 Tax=Escallonia herrerae TaxID=1293975 RepID=A0AA88V7S2_9ASTE|nr:hypothetical protein RJ639_018817 [Escallonia herrerae]